MLRSLFVALGVLAATSANASVVVNIYEDAGNVVTTYSGTLDLGGVSVSTGLGIGPDQLRPAYPAYYRLGGAYVGFGGAAGSGASWIGGTGLIAASSASGDLFGFRGDVNVVYFGAGYISGSLISGGMTFAGATLASLNMVEGIYNNLFTWGSGSNADSISMVISKTAPSPVPLPAGLPLLIAGLGAIGLIRRRKG